MSAPAASLLQERKSTMDNSELRDNMALEAAVNRFFRTKRVADLNQGGCVEMAADEEEETIEVTQKADGTLELTKKEDNTSGQKK